MFFCLFFGLSMWKENSGVRGITVGCSLCSHVKGKEQMYILKVHLLLQILDWCKWSRDAPGLWGALSHAAARGRA